MRTMIRSPEFESADGQSQERLVRGFLQINDPQYSNVLEKLPEIDKTNKVFDIVDKYSPGLVEKTGKALWGHLPPVMLARDVGTMAGEGYLSKTPDELPFPTRVWTKAVAALVDGPTGATGAFAQELQQNRVARAIANGLTPILEAGAFYLGTEGAGALAEVAGVGTASSAASGLRVALREGGQESIEVASRKAALEAAHNAFVKKAAAVGSVGTMQYGLHVLNTQNLNPIPAFSDPVFLVGVGLSVLPAEMLSRRYGISKARLEEATARIKGDPELQAVGEGAADFTRRLSAATGMKPREAGTFAFDAARGTLPPGTERRLREAFIRDPKLIESKFGLHVAMKQSGIFEPNWNVTKDGPTRVTYEDTTSGKRETIELKPGKELDEFKARLASREVVLDRAEGQTEDITALQEAHGPAPKGPPSATGSEPEPQHITAGMPSDYLPSMDEPMDPVEPLVHAQTRGAVGDGVWNLMKETEVEAEGRRAAPFGEAPDVSAGGERTPPKLKPGQKIDITNVVTRPGRMIEPATVRSEADPIGTTVVLPDGTIATRDRGSGTVSSLVTGTERTASKGTAERAEALKKGEALVLEDHDGSPVIATPDAETGDTIVTNQATGHSTRTKSTTLGERILDGYVPNKRELPELSDEELLVSTEKLARSSARAGSSEVGGLDLEVNEALLHHYLEFQRRTGTLGTTMEITRDSVAGYFDTLQEMLKSKRGSVEFGGQRPQPTKWTALPDDDLLSLYARNVGLKANAADGGRIVVELPGGTRQFYPSRDTALDALSEMSRKKIEATRFTVQAERAIREDRIPLHGAVPGDGFSDPLLNVMSRTAPLDDMRRFTQGTFVPHAAEFLRSVRGQMSAFGPEGRDLVHLFESDQTYQDLKVTESALDTEKAIENLTPDEVSYKSFTAKDTGGAMRDAELDTFKILDARRDQQYADLSRIKAEYGILTGKPQEMAPKLEGSAPHAFDWGAVDEPWRYEARARKIMKAEGLTEEQAFDRMEKMGLGMHTERIQKILEKRGMSRDEANSYIREKQKHAQAQKATHLEFARDNMPGYMTDLKRVYMSTFVSNIKRISQAHFYGPDFQVAQQLIDAIGQKRGRKAGEYAQAVFDSVVGKNARLSDGARAVLDWESNHLAFAVFAKSTESINDLLLTNARTYAKGMAKAFTQEGREFAVKVGAIQSEIRRELSQGSWEEILGPNPMFKNPIAEGAIRVAEGLEKTSTYFFQKAATVLDQRTTAVVGREYFKELMQNFADPARRADAISRLRELKITPEMIERARTSGELDALEHLATHRFLRNAQPRANKLSMPLFWSNHWAGRFLYQFKGYAFGQAGVIQRELTRMFKPESAADFRRGLRSFAYIATAFPAIGYAVAKGKQFTAHAGLPTRDTEEMDKGLSLALKKIQQGRWPSGKEVKTLSGAYLAALTYGHAFGYTQDLVFEGLTGNEYNLNRLFLPPVVGSALNLSMIGSGLFMAPFAESHQKAMTSLRKARRAVGRELPILGAGLELAGGIAKSEGYKPGLLSVRKP